MKKSALHGDLSLEGWRAWVEIRMEIDGGQMVLALRARESVTVI
jgi:hypothetical protein